MWGFFMKHLRFNKFKSDKKPTPDTAKLIKLKNQVRRLKRQRLILICSYVAVTAVVVYLVMR